MKFPSVKWKQARDFLSATGLPLDSLAQIWDLSDMDHDGSLSLAEFSIAMHCIAALEAVHVLLNRFCFITQFVLIQQTEAGEEKTPEKSSLKTSGSCSKGVSVHFKEEFLLSRSRPRPTRRLVTTTPLHLKPNQIVSSSSYYSSDNSDSEADRHLVSNDRYIVCR
eukprot:sb/3472580/